jgi:chromosome segregation ATPase
MLPNSSLRYITPSASPASNYASRSASGFGRSNDTNQTPEEKIMKYNEAILRLRDELIRVEEYCRQTNQELARKLLKVEREIRHEQNEIDQLEAEIRAYELAVQDTEQSACAVIEQIWCLMQDYHDMVVEARKASDESNEYDKSKESITYTTSRESDGYTQFKESDRTSRRLIQQVHSFQKSPAYGVTNSKNPTESLGDRYSKSRVSKRVPLVA